MNTIRTAVLHGFWIVVAALLSGCASSPEDVPGGGGTATVTFLEPEKFSDLQRSGLTAAKSRDVLLPVIDQFVQQEAARSLPAGWQLSLEFLEIDQAGRIPPTRHDEVRVISDNLPARLEFQYALRDPSGRVLKSGRESLSGQARDTPAHTQNPEELAVEKRLLRDWIRRLTR
jgi:hypothetical protein